MRKDRYIQQQRRKLTYEKQRPVSDEIVGLELPEEYKGKIFAMQHKKIRQAYFVEVDLEYKLARKSFPIVMRSLGIVLKTVKLYQIFDEVESQTMNWKQFLQAYLVLRNQKGSFNELSKAVQTLDKQYQGNWQQFFIDLTQLGDVMTQAQVQIIKQEVLQNKPVTTNALIDSLLGYQ